MGQPGSVSEYKVKAVFLYNFTHFIDWPESVFDDEYSPFIIGVIGSNPFGNNLEEAIAGERLRSHIMRVQYFDSVDEIIDCHILYINTRDPDEMKRILAGVAKRSILTVSDTPNFIRWGGMVRFFTEESKIRLEINNTLAKARAIKISSKLLRVAIVQ